MLARDNKAMFRLFVEEVYNMRNVAAVDAFLSLRFMDHGAPTGAAPGREGFKQLLANVFDAFPDFTVRIEDLIAEGDKVVSRSTIWGTHRREYLGIPSTGKPFEISEIHIFRFANGKVVEHWVNSDDLGMMQQLGVIPALGRAPA